MVPRFETMHLLPSFLLLALASLLLSSPALALPHLTQLAQHPTWLRLLHYEKGESAVLSEEFFLSPTGRHDPEAELQATLAASAAPWTDDPNSHARCRFPARYFWLSQQLDLPPMQCEQFNQWALLDTVQSISLLLVSGYLGNPASVFGHALLKLNTQSKEDGAGFFDLTINYGALVPEKEPTLLYIVRGLGGGYQAGFSDRYFYTQDLVYARTEFRDLWNYELILSEAQRTFLILHLWEILGKKFTYYFLDKNCAFRLATLLELVSEEAFLDQARFWYAPVEIFHRLEDLDRARKAQKQPGLIRSVRFMPSEQRSLEHQLGLLEAQEKKVVQSTIQQGSPVLQAALSTLEPERQAAVVEALLAHSRYRLVAEAPSPQPETLAIKDSFLITRLGLPPQTESSPEPPALDSPAQGNRPMFTALGWGYSSEQGVYARLAWSPFSQEGLGQNSLEGDELAVLDLALGFGGDTEDVFIEQLDLIRIRKLTRSGLALFGENAWSWQMRTGLQSQGKKQDFLFTYGLGRTWPLNPHLSFYAMLEGAAHVHQPHGRLRPYGAILLDKGPVRSRLYAGFETLAYKGEMQAIWGVEMQWQLARHQALFLGVNKEERVQARAALKWFW
jgi:hypothetical protein